MIRIIRKLNVEISKYFHSIQIEKAFPFKCQISIEEDKN